MTKVVGFDLDDTLVPEALFIRSGIHYIATILHALYPTLSKWRIINCMEAAVMTGRNHYSALESLLDETGLSGQVDMKKAVADFRSHLPDPSIYHAAPSTIMALTRLKKLADIKTVLITDGRSVTQRNKIKAAGLNAFFNEGDIFISEETGYDKHDPDTFLLVMDKYAGASEYHYVGDNPSKDFLHPSRLGWITHQAHPFPLMIHYYGMPR